MSEFKLGNRRPILSVRAQLAEHEDERREEERDWMDMCRDLFDDDPFDSKFLENFSNNNEPDVDESHDRFDPYYDLDYDPWYDYVEHHYA